jgi:hypothetical protein
MYAPLIWAGESPIGEEAPGPVASARQFAPVMDPFEHEMLVTVVVVALAMGGMASERTAAGR